MLNFLRFGLARSWTLRVVRFLWRDEARPKRVNDWLFPPEMRV